MDIGRGLLGNRDISELYEIAFYDDRLEEVANRQILESKTTRFSIPISDTLMNAAKGYLQVKVRVLRGGEGTPDPAQFHLRRGADHVTRLVGAVH